MRIGLLVFAALAASTLSSVTIAAGDESAAARPPNVVLIVADDVGYADLSSQGDARFATPNIDSIGRDGVRFTNGYVASAVCSPSRAALLTGRYPQRYGHEHNIRPRDTTAGLPTSEVALSTVLRERGYRTIAVGKWHLGFEEKFHPLSRGFDDFYGFLKGQRSYFPLVRAAPYAAMQRDRNFIEERFRYLTDDLGQQAVAYIDAHHAKPFFLYVAFSAVHTPMNAPPAYLMRANASLRGARRTLAAMTVSLDDAVGRILASLDAHDLREETIVIFLNDNGGAIGNASSNAPLRGHKGTTYEGGIRVPFAIRWPGRLPPGQVYDKPVTAMDVYPTIAAATGASPTRAKPRDGVDLMPHLRGERAAPPHDTLYWRRGFNFAIRKGRYKLVRYRGHDSALYADAPRLFDLQVDPGESNDLASEQPARVKELLADFRAWEEQMMPPLWGEQPDRARRSSPPTRGATPTPDPPATADEDPTPSPSR